MDFVLFLLLNATLFIRPSELVPELEPVPIYQCLVLTTTAAAFPSMLRQFTPRALQERPITVCVLGMVIAVPMSHLSHLFIWGARMSFVDFGKTAVYYLLCVAVINTHQRFDRFLVALLIFISMLALLPVLQMAGMLHVSSLEALNQLVVTEDGAYVVPRMRSTGIFNDPNDLAMILVCGIAVGVHALGTKPLYPLRLLFAAAVVLMAYDFWMTKSRGGMLALIAAMLVLCHARWGWRRAVLIGLLALPTFVAVLQMRGGDGLESGTGQARIQLWAEGFALWRQGGLLFGIGEGFFAEELHHVAHNSFVQCYTECGFFGGTMFFGAVATSIYLLYQLRQRTDPSRDGVSKRRIATVSAIVVGFGAAMLSLTRCYHVHTYLAFGLATACVRLEGQSLQLAGTGRPRLPFDLSYCARLSAASIAFVAATYVFVRLAVRWG